MSSQPTAVQAVMDAYRPVTISHTYARAVLAALGIPADTPTDDVNAAMKLYLDLHTSGATVQIVLLLDGETIEANRTTLYGEVEYAQASSASAAVLALAAKVEASDA